MPYEKENFNDAWYLYDNNGQEIAEVFSHASEAQVKRLELALNDERAITMLNWLMDLRKNEDEYFLSMEPTSFD